MESTQKAKTDESSLYRFCTFRLSERLYGVDIKDVKEINTEVNFTPIFHAPEEIKGYINIRGQIYLLLDPRKLFGFADKKIDETSRVVLFMPHVGEPCGVLVDSIEDVVTVDGKMIENRRQKEQKVSEGIERRAADVGEGVCKLQKELLIILSAERLLKSVINLNPVTTENS